ncbi:hypothetical protein QYF36_022092 [Acer negundo]|nr:hypothetical protein QYF36_022092 [Acer negundo]
MSWWSSSAISKSRIAWIEGFGIPLYCWGQGFFTKIGNLIGIYLTVEDVTFTKNRLDRGRMLVMIPHDQVAPSMIKMVVGGGSTVVKSKEDSTPVDFDWVERFLDLNFKSQISEQSSLLNKESSDLNSCEVEVCPSLEIGAHDISALEEDKEKTQGLLCEKKST